MMVTSISNNFIVQIQLRETHLKHGFFLVTACVQSTSYFSDLLVKHQTSPAHFPRNFMIVTPLSMDNFTGTTDRLQVFKE